MWDVEGFRRLEAEQPDPFPPRRPRFHLGSGPGPSRSSASDPEFIRPPKLPSPSVTLQSGQMFCSHLLVWKRITKNPDISIFSEKKQKGRDVNEAFEESVGPLSLLITSTVIVIRYAQKF